MPGTPAPPAVRLLAIASLRRDGGIRPRVCRNVGALIEYEADWRAGAAFPPVVVFFDGTDHWLADGYHRVDAAEEVGRTEIAAEIRPGSRRDAILFAVGANAEHGHRRGNADKHLVVERLLLDPEWCHWSDREIARRCRVSPTFVGAVRARLPETADPAGAAWVPTVPAMFSDDEEEPVTDAPRRAPPGPPAPPSVHGGQTALPGGRAALPSPPGWLPDAQQRTFTRRDGSIGVMRTATINAHRQNTIYRLEWLARQARAAARAAAPDKPRGPSMGLQGLFPSTCRLAELLTRRLLPGDRDEALRLLGSSSTPTLADFFLAVELRAELQRRREEDGDR